MNTDYLVIGAGAVGMAFADTFGVPYGDKFYKMNL